MITNPFAVLSKGMLVAGSGQPFRVLTKGMLITPTVVEIEAPDFDLGAGTKKKKTGRPLPPPELVEAALEKAPELAVVASEGVRRGLSDPVVVSRLSAKLRDTERDLEALQVSLASIVRRERARQYLKKRRRRRNAVAVLLLAA